LNSLPAPVALRFPTILTYELCAMVSGTILG